MSAIALPLTVRVAGLSAKQLVAKDRARAQKFLAGVHPHGPARTHEYRRKHHHGHGGGSGGGGGTAPPSGGGGTAPPGGGTGTGGGGTGTGGGGTAPGSGTGIGIGATDAGVTYTLSVGVGSPPQNFTLLIDTGSSNTWVGAQTKYVPTSTSKSTGNTVNVSYGSGSFSGTEYTDTVTLGPGLVIQNQSIGVASTATGFNDVDGIIGIGPVDLTSTTVSNTTTVPTVTDNLYSQGTIPTESIGISYEPTTSTTDATTNGTLTFGGIDTNAITGDVTYTPITSTSPASQYWGIDQTLSYGTGTTLLSGAAGIVDTGTTLLMMATDAFTAYTKATGGVMDSTTGLLTITEAQYNALESLVFTIGGTQFEMTPNAQIWPRALNSTLGGDANKIYLVAADLGSNSGSGLDFINGFVMLQRFYSIYDTTNSQVGFVTTPFTDATTN